MIQAMPSGSGAYKKGINIPQAFDEGVQAKAGNVVKSLSETKAEAEELQARLSEFKKLAESGNPEGLFKKKTFWGGGFKATKTTDGGMHYTGKGKDGERLSVWTGSDGKIQIIEKEGQQFYSDGERFQLKGNNATFVEFADGTTLFNGADGDKLQSRTSDGYTRFKDGQDGFSFTNFADGQGASYEFGDGESFKTYAGGAQEHTFANGTKIIQTLDNTGKPVTMYDSPDDAEDINFYTGDDGKTYAYRDGGVADLVDNVEFNAETAQLTNLQTSPQSATNTTDMANGVYFQAPDETLETTVPLTWTSNGITYTGTIKVSNAANMTTEALQEQVNAAIDKLAQDPESGITPDMILGLKEDAAQKVKENAALRPTTAEEQEAFQQVANANPVNVADMQELQNATAAGGNDTEGETGLSAAQGMIDQTQTEAPQMSEELKKKLNIAKISREEMPPVNKVMSTNTRAERLEQARSSLEGLQKTSGTTDEENAAIEAERKALEEEIAKQETQLEADKKEGL